jgi:hypothetical protein
MPYRTRTGETGTANAVSVGSHKRWVPHGSGPTVALAGINDGLKNSMVVISARLTTLRMRWRSIMAAPKNRPATVKLTSPQERTYDIFATVQTIQLTELHRSPAAERATLHGRPTLKSSGFEKFA